MAEVACYRLERALMGCFVPPVIVIGGGYHHQCPLEVLKKTHEVDGREALLVRKKNLNNIYIYT